MKKRVPEDREDQDQEQDQHQEQEEDEDEDSNEAGQPARASVLVRAVRTVLLGAVLFLPCLAVFSGNERREDRGAAARQAAEAPADRIDPGLNGRFVSATGTLSTDDRLEDPHYLRPLAAVVLQRDVESFTEKREKYKTQSGTVAYRNVTRWTYLAEPPPQEGPAADSSFGWRQSRTWWAKSAKVGLYEIAPRAAELPKASPLPVRPEDLAPADGLVRLAGPSYPRGGLLPRLEQGFIYLGLSTLVEPRVGDVRIRHLALRPGGTVTAFGRQSGSRLEPHPGPGGQRLLFVVHGTRDAALETMDLEFTTTSWLLWIFGVFLAWLGLGLFFGPVNTANGFLPVLDRLAPALVVLATLPAALGLAALASLLAQNGWGALDLLGLLGAVIAVLVGLARLVSPAGAES